jgi:tetratricopeptide (TPR) repeat protein
MTPAELQTKGYASYRAGDFARARAHFEAALGLFRETGAPEELVALSDLGAACSAMGDHEAARRAHEQALEGKRRKLGDRDPDVGVSLHNLGAVHRAQGRFDAAETCHIEALAIWRETLNTNHPLIAKGLVSLCAVALDLGHAKRATAYAQQVLGIGLAQAPPDHSLVATAMDDLATAQASIDNHNLAGNFWASCLLSLGELPGNQAPRMARIHAKRGISFRRQGLWEAAVACFADALRCDPNFTVARHHLAAALTRLGRTAEARPHLEKALSHQCVFVEASRRVRPAILILSVSTDGNIALEHLLPESGYTRIWWFIAHSRDPLREALPLFDIVLNAIGDAGMATPAAANIARFLQTNRKPVLNDPARVALTRRDRLPALLADTPGATTPATHRIEGKLTQAGLQDFIAKNSMTLPLLLRPEGTHGGKSLARIDDWGTFGPTDAATHYLTQFHEARAPDGYTRKYRMVFVDRVPFPYHLAISNHWLVHYISADMPAHAWKLAEESEFLANPAKVLGFQAMAALTRIARTIDLDYCGIDFTLLPDGKLLVFEANPTMLVHPEGEATPLAFKNAAVSNIVNAMRKLVEDRIKAGGDGVSPTGLF